MVKSRENAGAAGLSQARPKGMQMGAPEGAVLAVVVNYDGGEAVLRCLQSLADQSYPLLEIAVVDNASRDGSADRIAERFPRARLIRNRENLGWGVACNIGMNSAKSEFVALINNDAWLDRDCVAEMVRAVRQRKEYGSCASRILTAEGNRLEVCGLHIVADGSSCGRGRLEPVDRSLGEEEVFCANDCCCLYKRTMLEDIGPYDPDFFIYCDETDMGFRHQLAGWKCVYAPKAVAFHAHSLAAGSYSPFKAFYVERNRILLLWKYFPAFGVAKGFALSAYRYLLQVFLARKNRQGALARYLEGYSLWDGLGVLMRAHLSALKLLPRMLIRRWGMREIRRLDSRGFQDLFRRFGISVRAMAAYE
jgi:GT2 family glycosyltransferase